ncbi:MAG: sigma-70 family RNA polymerase sigma factor [Thermoanaerobaculia bacterium]
MSDKDTIRELLAGEPDTVDEVRSWIQLACVPHRNQLGNILEDLEQQVLLELTITLRKGRFKGTSSLRTFVRACRHHRCIDEIRRMSRRTWVDIDGITLQSSTPSILEEITFDEEVALALRVQAEMSEGCRELWNLLQQGLSYREMSRQLGVAEGTLRVRVLRCRKQALDTRARLVEGNSGNKSPEPSTV